jgi:hypothetical protein
MGLVQTVAPAVEPVSVEETKLHMRLTPDMTDDDADISMMITDARDLVERYLRRQLITATYVLYMDRFPYLTVLDPLNQANPKFDNANYYYGSPDRFAIWIPRPPLQSVTSIVYSDTTNTTKTFPTTSYIVDTYGFLGRIAPMYGQFWPGTAIQPNGVAITFVAGYGADGSFVPGMIKRAIKILVTKMYNGILQSSIPEDIRWLLYPYRALDERSLEYA